jgi:hypothetical protein
VALLLVFRSDNNSKSMNNILLIFIAPLVILFCLITAKSLKQLTYYDVWQSLNNIEIKTKGILCGVSDSLILISCKMPFMSSHIASEGAKVQRK